MNKRKAKLFRQLEDRKRAITLTSNPGSSIYDRYLPHSGGSFSGSRTQTVAEFAEDLHLTTEALLNQFSHAGVQGLTPSHRISLVHKSALLDFLRSQHSARPEAVFFDSRGGSERLVVVQDLNDQLLRALAREPNSVYGLDSRRFEELIAHILSSFGCEVNLTKRTRDGGYDIFGRYERGPIPITFLTECKRYSPSNKVGVEVVRSLYGLTEINRVNVGMIVTTSSFTKDAIEEKLRIGTRLDLKAFEDLKSWFSKFA